MNWEDERYVRLYTRDTGDWCALSWDGQALLMQLLRKADRAGVIQLGKRGRGALPLMLFHANEAARIDVALSELIDDGCVELHGSYLVIPNFTRAQETKQSDKQRQAESRAKRLAHARDSVRTETITSRSVTVGHGSSQPVTPNCTVPSRAELDQKLAQGSSTACAPAQGSLLPDDPKPPRPVRQTRARTEAPTGPVWEAYAAAIQARHNTKAADNAKVRRQLAEFLKRVPRDDAPAIVQFYVDSPDPFYVKNLHPVGLLLRDAEKLYAEWSRGYHAQQRAGTVPQPQAQRDDILSQLTKRKP